MNSLEKNIVEFVDVLRRSGVRVGTSEIIDSIKALEFIDILDREQVKIILASCMAKSKKEKEIFLKAFDLFFVSPASKTEKAKKRIEEIEQRRQEIEKETSELEFQGETIEIPDELKEVYANLPDNEKDKIKDFLDKTSTGKNVRPEFKKIAEDMVRRRLTSHNSKCAGHFEPIPMDYDNSLSETDVLVEDINNMMHSEDSLLYKNIGDLTNEDIPRVIAIIRAISEAIKRDTSRRLKRSSRKARLDLKKTIRSNLSTGGSLFKLKFKRRSGKKIKYLVLCDVSASMYRFSGFVLQFLLGMYDGNSYMDTCMFSESLERFNMSSGISSSEFESRVKKSELWMKGTNINKALMQILESRDSVLSSSTVVLIISDAKTLEWENAVANLEVIKTKAKKIFWLNPLPKKNWKTIAGIDGFTKHSVMLDCSTLERLFEACRSI